MYEYAYMLGIIILGIIWGYFFIIRKDLRREQLIVSIFSAPLAPISQVLWFSNDYWNPEYIFSLLVHGVEIGIEEPLFAFFIGGIVAILYEVIRGRKHSAGRKRPIQSLIVIFGTVLVFLILKFITLNTIWASSLALLIGGIVILVLDRDLIEDAIGTLVSILTITFLIYWCLLFLFPGILDEFWISGALSGHRFLFVPIEEIFWFASWGLFAGVIYEFWVNVERYSKV